MALPDFDGSTVEVAKTYSIVVVSLADIVSNPLALMLVPDATPPVPAALELTLHVTVVTGSLIPVTIALNCRVLPLVTDWFGGLIVTPVTVGISTVTAAMPVFDGSTVEVAITYRVVKVSLADIVSNPFAFMLVPCVTPPVPAAFELTLHVTVVAGSLIPVTAALNWKVLPLVTDWFEGLTVTPVTTGISTLTAALPYFDGSITEAAITYRVVKVSFAATVSKPLAFTLVPCVTPPVPAAFELTLHVTALSGLLLPVTVALNCKVLPADTDGPEELTVTPDIETTLICL